MKVPLSRIKWRWVGQTDVRIVSTDNQKLTASKHGKHYSIYICNLHKSIIITGQLRYF
jgi:hypothetical protein